MRHEGATAFSMIEKELPNGFHDGELHSFTISRERREMSLEMSADMSDSEVTRRIVHRRCRVSLTGLIFVQVEAPCVPADSNERDTLIDDGDLNGDRLARVWPDPLPRDSFARWIFLNATNGFIYFAATGAELEWLS